MKFLIIIHYSNVITFFTKFTNKVIYHNKNPIINKYFLIFYLVFKPDKPDCMASSLKTSSLPYLFILGVTISILLDDDAVIAISGSEICGGVNG
ncbi:hypothetical protein C1646_718549 [Rhizophagus diaphanus]|nr:hypothetical protein C1646_718549 [Rhizophagus diaphanus] [Rhizophagus sp. MUCL 43196]